MEQLLAHTTLRRKLAHSVMHKYSVTQYCQDAGMGRGRFYTLYTGLSDLFCNTLQFEIRKHFNEYQDCDSRQLIYALIREIGDYRIYYFNLYHLSSKRNETHICHQLNKTLFKEMQRHLFNSDFSNKRIKSVTNIIFTRIKDWIAHSCNERVLDVYTDLSILLP